MALSGLDIYKLLPKTNCKECGFATCLAFAMALAQKKVSLDKCPHVTAQARQALESAAQPPIKLVTIGTAEASFEVGNETVMYRHEQKFHHPTALGILIEDTLSEDELSAAVAAVNGLRFERVGQKVGADLICVRNSSGYRNKFLAAVSTADALSRMAIALYSDDAESMAEAVKLCRERRPLIICGEKSSPDAFIALAKEYDLPIALTCENLDEAADLTARANAQGVSQIALNFKNESMSGRIQEYTYARRAALKKNFRPLGYPIIAFTESADPDLELAEAVSYMAKYAGIVIMKNSAREFVYPFLVARQDIYQDPQKPVQVEPKIYEIGRVTADSPVLVTTNFSITYFTVAGEVESSKVPSYVICVDAEGMSVLTAWAAEKFTAEKITDVLKRCGIEEMVSHRTITLPGYVAVLSGKLEEISGWKVSVGPREASGITGYLRNWKA
ncbi:MAG: acetyl-CoA decarbonylase/synthase complex subunit gamma [Candidatus Omnitrophica bacterium]|nr:acetyl-CoA decarbonylase/synthase complex subunit gamma [Candidatus Omnitrophota bacterium]